MKNCYKPMLLCLAIAVLAILVLPRFGFQIAGASAFFGLLMVACCVLPMVLMMFGILKGDGNKSCCAPSKGKDLAEEEKKGQSTTTKKAGCH